MTIHEVEAATGLERATIRYYEAEGLVAPERENNGYRSYSERDVELLRRVKLLRALGVPIEELRRLKSGERELSGALTEQLLRMEGEQARLAASCRVCRAMVEDNAAFATLDAMRYLEALARPEDATEEKPAPVLTPPTDRVERVRSPWLRYFARTFDQFIYALIILALALLVFRVSMAGVKLLSGILGTILTLALMMFLEPLWLMLCGTTPGKWLLGLSVRGHDGMKLTYSEGLSRTWRVIRCGLGFGIPIYSLYRLWRSRKQALSDDDWPEWEDDSVLRLRDESVWRVPAYLAAVGAYVLIMFIVTYAALLPVNRGPLTPEEYAENFNRLADFYGVDVDTLQADGTWAPESGPDDGGVVIHVVPENTLPDMDFTVVNGELTGVRMVFNSPDEPELDFFTREQSVMQLAAMSLVGAQRELPFFRMNMGRVAKECTYTYPHSYTRKFGPVAVSFTSEGEGYVFSSGAFFAQEGGWYRVTFDMRKGG